MRNYQLEQQIPSYDENVKTACYNCHELTSLFLDHPNKGRLYLCSRSCQSNFSLKSGMRSYNTVRDHSTKRLTTVGKLQDLTSEELARMLEFKQGYNKYTMNRQKKGDSLDRVLGIMSSRHKTTGKVTKLG